MRRLPVSKRIVLVLVLLSMIAVFAFAEESVFFVKTVPISKVYLYREGYRIVYMKGDLTFAEMYLPIEWFSGAGVKGELVLGDDPAYPYCSIFWKDGVFDHIRLYLKKDIRDPSWGEARRGGDIADRFKDETPKFEF
jgi:hypothetical protein